MKKKKNQPTKPQTFKLTGFGLPSGTNTRKACLQEEMNCNVRDKRAFGTNWKDFQSLVVNI